MDDLAPVDVDQLCEEVARLEQVIASAQAEIRRVYALLGLAPLRVLEGGKPKLKVVR